MAQSGRPPFSSTSSGQGLVQASTVRTPAHGLCGAQCAAESPDASAMKSKRAMARAGTTTPFWWGSSISATQANDDSTYPLRAGPRVTGVREPSAWITSRPIPGVCRVSTATYGNGSRTAGTINYDRRVIRGGSSVRPPAYSRSSFRSSVAAADRRYAIGFRLARSLER